MGHIARWRTIPEETIKQAVAESFSFRELASKLGYSLTGGSTMTSLKKMCQELKLDTSHFKGQGWNKGNYDYSSFSENSPKKNGKTTLNPLIALRGRRCENCGLEEWLGQPINLQIHHIDGDRTNNSLDNLKLLCPNCHSYTSNFARKNTTQLIIPEEEYVRVLRSSKSIHSALLELGLTPKGGNYTRARELIEKYNISHLQ